MKNRKGFTLVELLAVIIILGVLLVIAVPKVSQYITKSKKDGFLAVGKLVIKSARQDLTSELFPLPIQTNDVTIITQDMISLEEESDKSSFGGKYLYNKSYVAVINIGTGIDPEYLYFYAAQDSKDYAIPLTVESELSTDKIIAKAKNKMEVTIQSLCGSEEGKQTTNAILKGLEEYQPVDANGNKLDWNVTIFSTDGCGVNE